MSDADVVRAWKDRRYRRGLSQAQRARLPEHPAGAVQLSDEKLQGLGAGAEVENTYTVYPCTGWCTLWCTSDCTSF